MSPVTLPAVAVFSTLLFTACGEPRAPERSAAQGGAVRVLATVNGAPITERDVEHRAKRGGVAVMPGHERSGDILQTVVRDELAYQQALRLGLDRDPEYQLRLDDLEAQVRTFRRQELAGRLRSHAMQQASVSEGEARAYYDENAALLRTRFHVLQILRRGGEAELLADRDEVKAGAPFEEVAWKRFPGMPREGKAPWDLGELAWFQLPSAWRGVVDRLEPGQVSEVVREGDRYWLLKLAGKRVDPAVSFATERDRIVEILKVRKADELHAKLLAEAKAQGKVVYATEPATKTARSP